MAKQLINFDPIFSPGVANAGYLDFSAMDPPFNLERLYAVINVTRNVLLYTPGVPTAGIYATNVASLNGSIIYLAQDTSSYSSSDKINVIYDTDPGTFGEGGSNNPMERGGMLEAIFNNQNQILLELQLQSYLLQQGLFPSTINDVDQLRNDLQDQRGIEGLRSTGLG